MQPATTHSIMSPFQDDLHSFPSLRHPLPSDFIPRHALNRKLGGILNRDFTIVCAPAGMGKSSAVSGWLAEIDAPFVWLSLNEGDDFSSLLRRLAQGLSAQFSGYMPGLNNLATTPLLPDAESIMAIFIRDLAALPERFVLVLDDYDRLADTKIRDFIEAALRLSPENASHLRLVLISRTDPLLPIVRLSLSGRLTILRSQDLRFDAADTDAFLQRTAGIKLEPEQLELVVARTEGWIAGLRLTVLSLGGASDPNVFVNALHATNSFAFRYLMEEVFANQPPDIQDFLMRTSFLDRFCRSLCITIVPNFEEKRQTGESASGDLFEWLINANLFLVALDQERGWYRYNPLFRDLLQNIARRNLPEAEIVRLRHKACDWFESQNLLDDALTQALALTENKAADVVERYTDAALDCEDYSSVQRWLSRLTVSVIESRPALLLAQGWLLAAYHKSAALKIHLDAISGKIPKTGEHSECQRNEWETLRASLAYLQNRHSDCLRYISAVDLSLDSRRFLRREVIRLRSISLHLAGDSAGAVRLLRSEAETYSGKDRRHDLISLLKTLSQIYLWAGDLVALERQALQLLNLAEEAKEASGVVWGGFLLLCVYGQWRQLGEGLDSIMQRADPYVLLADVQSRFAYQFAVASMHLLRRNVSACDAAIADLMDYAMQLSSRDRMAEVEAFRAQVALMRGDIDSAVRWAEEFNPNHQTSAFSVTSFMPSWVVARILIARNAPGDAQTVLTMTDALMKTEESSRLVIRNISTLLIRATALEKLGRISEAASTVAEAVSLGRPGRIITSFVGYAPLGCFSCCVFDRMSAWSLTSLSARIASKRNPSSGTESTAPVRRVVAVRTVTAPLPSPRAHGVLPQTKNRPFCAPCRRKPRSSPSVALSSHTSVRE